MSVTINIGPYTTVQFTDREILHSHGRDFLGRPVFSDVTLKAGDHSITFINATVTVDKSFTVTKTEMQGRKGTVKEYIGSNDFNVTILADIINDDPNKYPADDVQTVYSILESEKQIEVISEFLSLFDIHYLVPDKEVIAQDKSVQNRQRLELHFFSDKDIQLIIEEEDSLAPQTPAEATFND